MGIPLSMSLFVSAYLLAVLAGSIALVKRTNERPLLEQSLLEALGFSIMFVAICISCGMVFATLQGRLPPLWKAAGSCPAALLLAVGVYDLYDWGKNKLQSLGQWLRSQTI